MLPATNTGSGSIVAIDSTILAKVIESVSEVESLGAVVVDVWLPGVIVDKLSVAELSPFQDESKVFRFSTNTAVVTLISFRKASIISESLVDT